MADFIANKDLKLKPYVEKYGLLRMGKEDDIFTSLVYHIIGQMLSNKVAYTLCSRFKECVGVISPKSILNVSDNKIRECGISGRKVEYIKTLCLSILDNKIDLIKLESMTDEKFVKYLTQIKGIGVWTAEMIACFSLGRLNIFCYEDAALRLGIMKVHKEFKTLSEKRFNKLKKLYSPYCSVAASYYYHVNDYEK